MRHEAIELGEAHFPSSFSSPPAPSCPLSLPPPSSSFSRLPLLSFITITLSPLILPPSMIPFYSHSSQAHEQENSSNLILKPPIVGQLSLSSSIPILVSQDLPALFHRTFYPLDRTIPKDYLCFFLHFFSLSQYPGIIPLRTRRLATIFNTTPFAPYS